MELEGSATKAYKPPKLKAVPYEEPEKKQKISEKLVRKVRDELSGRPMEIVEHKMTADELERQQFEEEYFLRLPDVKKMKKDLKAAKAGGKKTKPGKRRRKNK